MISLPLPFLKAIVEDAETSYPRECCGLLIGRDDGAGSMVVTQIVESPNIAEPGVLDRFEIDPQVRFDVMKTLDENTRQGYAQHRIIGHYHSHPDHPAQPSATDLSMAYEPDLVWMITSVIDAQAVHTTAHVVDQQARQFREIPLRTTDWQPYPVRPPSEKE
jgi:proteasome lid subunit RPN8/RPN11